MQPLPPSSASMIAQQMAAILHYSVKTHEQAFIKVAEAIQIAEAMQAMAPKQADLADDLQ